MAKRKQAVRLGLKSKNRPAQIEKILSFVNVRQLFGLAVIVLVIFGGVFAYEKFESIEILPIETVEIEGEFKYLMPDDLKKHAMPEVQDGFFSVKLGAIREKLLHLPWVEDVSIHRQWPQTLRIRVMEKQPVAFWGSNGYVSSKGDLFEPEFINRDLQLPLLNGLDGQHSLMLKHLGKMQLLLAAQDMVVVKMEQDLRRSWTLVLSAGFELRLGRNDMYERLQRFVDVYDQHLRDTKNKIKHVDMRYTNGFAVAYKDQVTQSRGA